VRRNQLRQRINVTDQEVKQLAKLLKDQGSQTQRFHIEHILVNLPSDASADEQQQAMDKANKIMGQLKHGGDFHEIAVAQSDDDQALNGGDWGWMTLEEMPTQMADVVKGAQEGQFIGPFRSGAGLHIIHIKELQGQAAATMMEVKARHILIKTSVILSDEKAKQTLNNLLNQIKTGSASFANLAKKYSDDTGSAENGGELGWADPGMYAPEFRDQVTKLPVGQISQPFKTQFGWHIVEVEDRRNQANTSDALNNKAYQLIYNRRFAEEAQAWMDELRDEAYIKVLDGSSN
jgi:peptidyl-prolyl cis-trans isomerase SurA